MRWAVLPQPAATAEPGCQETHPPSASGYVSRRGKGEGGGGRGERGRGEGGKGEGGGGEGGKGEGGGGGGEKGVNSLSMYM